MADLVRTRRVKADIEELMRDMAINMSEGSCQAYDDYRYQVGVVYGLRMAMNVINNAEKDLE